MNTSEPTPRHRRARHLAPKPRPHTTTPSVRPAPVARITPPWELEAETWTDAWLTADDRKAYPSHGVAA